jgi:hypothetical protein
MTASSVEPGSGIFGADVGGVACEASEGALAITPISASVAHLYGRPKVDGLRCSIGPRASMGVDESITASISDS